MQTWVYVLSVVVAYILGIAAAHVSAKKKKPEGQFTIDMTGKGENEFRVFIPGEELIEKDSIVVRINVISE